MVHGACRAAVRAGAGAVVWGPECPLWNLAVLCPGLRELCRCVACGTACTREAIAQRTLNTCCVPAALCLQQRLP